MSTPVSVPIPAALGGLQQGTVPGVTGAVGPGGVTGITPPVPTNGATNVGPSFGPADFDSIMKKAYAGFKHSNIGPKNKHADRLHNVGTQSHKLFSGDGNPLTLPHSKHQPRQGFTNASGFVHKDVGKYIKRDIEKLVPAKLSDIAEAPQPYHDRERPPISNPNAMFDYVVKPGYHHLPRDQRTPRTMYDAGIKHGPRVIGGANTEHRIREFLGKRALSASHVDSKIVDMPDHLRESGGFPRRVQGYSVGKRLKSINELREMQRKGSERTVHALFDDPYPVIITKKGHTGSQIDHERQIRESQLHAQQIASKKSDTEIKNFEIVDHGGIEDAHKQDQTKENPTLPTDQTGATAVDAPLVVTHTVAQVPNQQPLHDGGGAANQPQQPVNRGV